MIEVSLLLRNLYTEVYSGYTSLHFHKQCTSVPFSHPHWHLFIIFLIIPILISEMNYCFNLHFSDLEHLFCAVNHSYNHLWKMFLGSFLFTQIVPLLLKSWILYIFELLTPFQIWKYFLLFHRLCFHFVDGFLCHMEDIWPAVVSSRSFLICVLHSNL